MHVVHFQGVEDNQKYYGNLSIEPSTLRSLYRNYTGTTFF